MKNQKTTYDSCQFQLGEISFSIGLWSQICHHESPMCNGRKTHIFGFLRAQGTM